MKQFIILLLCLFPLVGKANPYDNILSLKKGDWIRFEQIGYYPVEGQDSLRNYWDDRNIFRIQIKATVMDMTDQTVRMGIQYEYHSDAYVRKDDSNGFFYYDSRFANDLSDPDKKLGSKIEQAFNLPPDIYPTEKEYNLSSGEVINSKTIFETPRYSSPLRYISNGIQRDSSISVTSMGMSKDIDELPHSILGAFIREWSMEGLPLRIVHRIEGAYPAETRVVGASFELPHNIKLLVKNPHNPELNVDTTFFCSFPQKVDFAQITWLVSPGDSIVMTHRGDAEDRFSGKGAAENNLRDAQRCEPNVLVPILKGEITVKKGLEQWNTWYDALYQRYEPNLSEFWKKSFQLTRNYYAAERVIYDYRMKQMKGAVTTGMVWNKDIFGSLSPITDYLFLPDYYDDFLTNFCYYKEASIITDNLSALRNNSMTYYFAKQVLFGYPSYRARTNMLISNMKRSKLAQINTEYADFTQNCRYPELTQQIQQQYNLYKKIEPGEKIQDAGFAWTDDIRFSDNKKESYTLIALSSPPNIPIRKELIEVLNKAFEENGLSGKLNIALFYPESENRKESLSTAKNTTYTFLSYDKLYSYLIFGYTPIVILVRNDGTILYRSLSMYPFNNPDIVTNMINLLKGDLQNPTAAVGFAYWKELFLALFISGLFFFLWVRFKQQKERRKRMFVELEQKALRSQMNPHFIFNALSSIQSLILHKQTEKADRYLIHFSKLLRLVLQSSQKELIALSEEVEQIRLYVSIEQLRLPFTVEWYIDERIDMETTDIPGMLIQPLVENAIKHGIVPQGGGVLKIDIRKRGHLLYIAITDNGSGIDHQKLNLAIGLGIKNVRERIKLYKEKFHTNITFALENNTEDGQSGCKAELQIPIE